MADENFIEPVHNLMPSGAITPHTESGSAPPPRTTGIVGQVVAVHRARTTASTEAHILDVTVGADDYTEIVIRVPNRPYAHLEGKRAILYVQDLME
jgi:hypothetical protein